MRINTNVTTRAGEPSPARRNVVRSIVLIAAVALGAYAFASPVFADPPTAPDAPSITGITLGQNSVTVDFTPGSDGGDSNVTYLVDCTGGTERTNSDTASPITVSNLDNGADYSCTVTATNDEGSSPASDASDTFTAITVPDAPTIAGVTLGSNSASVAFTANGDGGDDIVLFKATCTSSTGGTTRTKTGAASPLNVTSLTNSKHYTCTVSAENSLGFGANAVASNDFVAGAAPPAPTISGVTRGNDSAFVAISSNGNGGSAITGYSASCVSSDGGTTQAGSGGSSPVEIDSLTDGKTYTCTARVTNSFGTSNASVASGSVVAAVTPQAPTIGSVTRGHNSADVAFTSNGTGGDPITSFTATCTSSDGGTTRSASNGASPVTVGSLSNGKTYTCAVYATNGVGNGTSSADSTSFVAATVPAAPTVTDIQRGSNAAVVSFSSNGNGSDTITGYTVACTSTDGGSPQSQSGTTSPVSVGSLANGKTYTCNVVATNHIGDSLASADSDSIVVAAVPDAPTITDQTLSADASTISFDAPVSDGGDSITGYTVTCTSSGEGVTQSATDVASPIEVDSLTTGEHYTCTVHATNSIGDGAESTASDDFVAATAPDAPTLTGVTRGSNSAVVAFTAGSNNGDAITSFTATCTSTNGGTQEIVSGGSSPITVGSLTNAKIYNCNVFATNSYGNSFASSDSSNFTAATVPAAPTIGSKTLGSNAVTVAFSANSTGADPITSYTVTCPSSDGGATEHASGGASPIEVDSLTNGNTYTCTVVATNGIGDSAASAATSAFVASGVPDAPTINSVDLSDSSVVLSLTAGNSNGGQAVNGYTATCRSSNGGATQSGTSATTSVTVSTLTAGKLYTCTAVATNAVGDSLASAATSSFTAGAVPDAPTITGYTRGVNSAVVSFTANGDGSDTIQAFKVTCTSSNAGVSRSKIDLASPITVSSLTNGKTYTCKAYAINGIGFSVASSATSSFVAANVPSAPTIGTATAGPDNASVTFTANGTGGSAITGFTVMCTSGDGGTTQSNSGGSSPIVVTLDVGFHYTCTAIATNAIGDSASSAATGSFLAATVPDAPTIGAVTQGINSASVAFTVNGDGSSSITGLTATCTSSDGGTTRSNTGNSSPIVVSTLTNAKTYTCKVKATNSFGDSPWSADSTSFSAANVPSAPTIGVATRGGNSASVAFTANGNGGSAITGFTVTCTSSDGLTTRSGTNTSSPIVVSNLSNGNTYTCTAIATNIAGNSVASAATSSFVAATSPSTPVITGVTRGPNNASVAFTVTNNGDAITGVLVTCTSSNAGATKTGSGTTSPVLVSALTNGKTYTCTMTATNTFGTSAASAASSSFVAATVSGAPTMGAVTHTNGNATVSFTAPTVTGGAAITSYTVTCSSTNGGTTKSTVSTRSPTVVTGLTVGKTYHCNVFATNAIGNSINSASSVNFVA
jgi:titin